MVINMNNNFNIGNRLFELRTNLGLSQEQLALQADITTIYLGQIEHNTKRPTVYVIEKICKALNITLKDFFDIDNFSCKYDIWTDQILIKLQKCSIEEKKYLLEMCKHLKLLRNNNVPLY